jgi:Ca-activated chloride channel family protein
MTTQLYWREPLWLLLALQPFAVMWLRSLMRRRQTTRYAEPALQPWAVVHQREGFASRLFSKNGAYIAAWCLLAIAAAGPRLPLEIIGEQEAQDANIMLVVDISRSMSAADVRPNRLRRAQIELEELLTRAEGLRLGVIVYAARAHLYVPPTADHDALRFYLASLDALTPPTQGSRPGEALALAYEELRAAPGKSAVILVTDGDFTAPEKNTVDIFSRAQLPIYVLGTGSIEGDAIPYGNEWLTHDGQAVISRLNEAALRELAHATGGVYSPARDDDSDWAALYDYGIAKRFAAPPRDLDDTRTVWRELYAWPLLPGLVLLWYALLPFRMTLRRMPVALLAPILLLPYPHQDAQAAESATQAYEYFAQGNFAAALATYKNLTGFDARLGEGVSGYRLNDYAGAVRQFQQAVLEANTDTERGMALFNLGNGYFQLGDYKAAATVFQDALLYRPAHAQSRHNLDFSRALQQAVEERLQRAGETRRAGSGPQRATPSESLAVSGDASLTLDDEAEPKTPPLPELPATTGGDMEALIARGLAHVRLAAEATGQEAASARRTADIARAQQQMEALQDTQPLLWKRLFEMEEGFDAPLAAPREVPGVSPW